MDASDYAVREEEVPWQTMSVPIPLIGKAAKWRQLYQPIRAKTCSSLREMTGQNQPQLPETVPYSQQRESAVFRLKEMHFGLICHGV